MPQMVIANRLGDGRVVYLATDGGWVESINAGRLLADEAESEQCLAIAWQAEADCEVVAPYLIDLRLRGNGREAVGWRESIRANGPTVQTARS